MFRKGLVVLALVASFHAAAPATAHANDAALVARGPRLVPASGLPCLAAVLLCIGHGAVVRAAGHAAGAVGHAVAGGAKLVARSVMSPVVSWVADGAAWLVTSVAKEIDRSARPALQSRWFLNQYGRMVALSGSVAAVFLLLAVGQAILAQNPWRLIRTVAVALPCATLLTFAAITLVQIGLDLTDWMTEQMLAGTHDHVRSAFKALTIALSPAGPLAPFALFLAALVVALLSLLVWFELVMREAAIYVAVAFLPLTLMAVLWDRTANWSRRLAEGLASIVLAKFTIATAFALAGSAIVAAPTSGGGGLSALLAGSSVLLIAALTPAALLKIIPLAEGASGQMLGRGHAAAAVGAIPGSGTAADTARRLASQHFSGDRAASAPASSASSATPQRLPTLRPPSAEGALPTLPADHRRDGARK